jgi:hypothetical protein
MAETKPERFPATSEESASAIAQNVLLFSGHMIDAPGRTQPRFPSDREPLARDTIVATLAEIGAGHGDLAICGGACGGDLIFAEACLARGMRLELYIPFDQSTFLAHSVDFADADWHDRFLAAKSKAVLHVMPDELGQLRPGEGPYERNNMWMLEQAARFGPERIAFICLWDGQSGDGSGGTWDLMAEARRRTNRIYWLDTRKLWD